MVCATIRYYVKISIIPMKHYHYFDMIWTCHHFLKETFCFVMTITMIVQPLHNEMISDNPLACLCDNLLGPSV